MPTRTALRATLMAVILGGLLLLPGTAFAQYPPAQGDFVTCTPAPASPGDNVGCTGGVFQNNSDVDVVVTASTLLDTTVTADGDGTISFSFTIPADHPTGTYEVTLAGIGPDGTAKVVTETTFRIVAATAGGGDNGQDLATTGTGVLPIGLIGVGVLAVGGAVVASTRRRRDRDQVNA